jgi:hypothetical protein
VTPAQLRKAALALPGAEERETWGEATFRVRDKMFALMASDGTRASVKATLEQQAELLAAAPEVYSVASYVGRYGWVAIEVAAADAGEVAELLEDAWRRTAPKAAVRAYDQDMSG